MTVSALNLTGAGMPPLQAQLIGNTIATVAGIGTAQATAAPLLNNVTLGTTTGGATAFVISTIWAIGSQVTFFNTSSTAALLYPPSGGALDGGSTDASISIPQNTGYTFIRTTSTDWRSGAILTASSLSISGNASVGGTLGVTGATTLSSTAHVVGAATLDSTLAVAGLATFTAGFKGGTQALSGAGAINTTTLTTKITTTGANALTLADGADGQVKILTMVADGGDGTLTPTTKTGYSTIVFNDAGDGCILVFTTTTGWMVVANNGCTIS